MIRNIRTPEGGFTILELIIVLTITVALLGSALLLFQQRIPRTQFETAVNELTVQLSDAASQVSSGYYPNTDNLQCTGASLTVGTEEQGTNENCLFIGQAFRFGSPDVTACPVGGGVDGCNDSIVYTVYGRRTNLGAIVTNLKDSYPRVPVDDVAQRPYTNGYGMYFTRILSGGAGGDIVGGIAYLQTFGSTVNNDGSPSGASQLQIVPLKNTNLGQPKGDFLSTVNANVNNQGFLSDPNPDGGIKICLRSSQTDQYATVLLAGNGVTTSIERKIFGDYGSWDSDCK